MLRLRTVTTGRIPAGFVALVLAVAGASYLAPGPSLVLLAAGAPPRLSLNVNLASSQELSAVSTGSLVAEVNAIWWNSNLSLIWRTADVSDPLPAMPESENWLRVLVLARQTTGGGDTATFTVGELVRVEGAKPLAIASVTAAHRVVDESLRFQILNLLGPSHASQGLMRANIDALEFADVRSRAFLLDQPARASLVRRASLSASSSYATR